MKGAITLGEGCIDTQPSRLANCLSIEMNEDWGEPPPFRVGETLLY